MRIFFFVFFSVAFLYVQGKFPAFLKNGDKIMIVAPSGALNAQNRQNLRLALEVFKNWQVQVVIGKNVFKNSTSQGGWAGSDKERLEDLQEAISNKDIKAIFCARGGYGASRIIRDVKFHPLVENPKWIIGYSDITIILTTLDKKNIYGGIHGAMPASGFTHEPNLLSLERVLFGNGELLILKGSHHTLNRKGRAKAKIVGGNLSLLAASLGSDSEVDTKGKILFVEEISESLYVVDRYFNSLKNAGKLDHLEGLIIGQFTNCKPDNYFPIDHRHLISQFASLGNFPIAFDLNFGHERENLALPLGAIGELVVDTNGSTLKLSLN